MGARDLDFLFVVGSPRSGTSWLHQMLGTHPSVAAMEHEELTVFTRYLGPWAHSYDIEDRAINMNGIRQGIPCLFALAELHELMRGFVDTVYGRLLERRNPTATHVLDKHPNYSNQIPLINELLPRSRFIHIIRDGRDVVVSMNSAYRRVGFGAGDTRGAISDWHRNVTNARAQGSSLGAERYLEVRYEELLGDTRTHLRRIVQFCGLPCPDTWLEATVANFDISNRQVSRGDTSHNALRRSSGGIWSRKLGLRDRYTIDHMAGPLLEGLRYADRGWWRTGPLDRLRIVPLVLAIRLKRSWKALHAIWSTTLEQRLP